MKECIIEVLKKNTGMDTITEEMRFGEEIMMTSINIMKTVYDIEEELDINDIPIEAMYDIETVGELIKLVEECK